MVQPTIGDDRDDGLLMTHRKLSVALLLAAALAPAWAADLPREKDRWLELRTDNFIFFSNAGERTTRRVATDLEQLRAVLGGITNLELSSPVPIFVYVFKHDGSFEPYKHLYDGRPAATAGYFNQREHANYIAIDGGSRMDASGIVYHEYVNYFASTNLPRLPLWFEEGLAELYQTFQVSGSAARVGLPIGRHLFLLKTSPILPLAELFRVDHGSPEYNEADRKGAFYAESWALVHYLLIGNQERRAETTRFVTLLHEGLLPEDAFEEAFTVDTAELEQEFRRYLDRRIYPHLEAPIELDLSTQMSVRPLPYPDVLYRLGDLLAQQEPPRPEAADHFRAAVELDPSHGPSLAALGRLAEDRARWSEAETLYRRALVAAPSDPLVQYRGGAFLLRRGGDVAAAREALRRSALLQPGYAPAWVALTGSYMAAAEYTDEALHAAETAHRLLPSRTDVSANLLRLYLETGRRADAVALATGAFSSEPAELRLARGIIARSDLERARRLIQDGQSGDALEALDNAEAAIAGTPDDELIRRQIAVLRSNVIEQRMTARYNEAVHAYNAGDVALARDLLFALRDEAPPGRHADAVDSFLEFIDNPEAGARPPSADPALTEASPGEIDRLNELISRNQLDEALIVLEDLRHRVGAGRRTWIDLKIEEIGHVRDRNRFIETFNRAVTQYNGGAYRDAIATLEALLADQPDAPDADSARDLLTEARAALENRER
jgi:tetratricopeptide (TPR) repeat protein